MLDGRQTSFAEFAGKLVMVVNVASKCGLTPQYAQLEELQKRFGVVGLPTVVFVDKKGRVLKEPQVTGFIDADAYARVMKRVR